MKFIREKTVVMDIQFLRGKNDELIVKEMGLLRLNHTYGMVYHFLPPYPEGELNKKTRTHNAFLYKSVNKLCWDYGNLPFTTLSGIVTSFDNYTIIVKGLAKKRIFEEISTACYNCRSRTDFFFG